jgi:hypothetical protein
MQTHLPASARADAPTPELRVDTRPIEQWLHWEERANLIGFRVATAPIDVAVAAIPLERVSVLVAARAPREIVRRFLRDGCVHWPKHPLNRDTSVAFHDAPAAETWQARYTSSRTLAVPGQEAPLFSIKLPTDHPHPDFVQPEKTRLRQEVRDALEFARRVERIDAALGADPRLVVVREVLGALAPESESGFLVRDLRPLQDGSYWLPALSIPYSGREIARAHGAAFEEFWGRAYAEAVGRTKALLFARYGLQYDTPNPQNILVQLDSRLRPTGVIALRDLGDTAPIVEDGLDPALPWLRMSADLAPETRNSFWAFDEADDRKVDPAVIDAWCERHDRAYLAELARFFALGDLPATLAEANALLRSAEGERAIAAAFDGSRPTPRAA